MVLGRGAQADRQEAAQSLAALLTVVLYNEFMLLHRFVSKVSELHIFTAILLEGGGSVRDGPGSAPREGQPSPLDGPDLVGREGRA